MAKTITAATAATETVTPGANWLKEADPSAIPALVAWLSHFPWG